MWRRSAAWWACGTRGFDDMGTDWTQRPPQRGDVGAWLSLVTRSGRGLARRSIAGALIGPVPRVDNGILPSLTAMCNTPLTAETTSTPQQQAMLLSRASLSSASTVVSCLITP